MGLVGLEGIVGLRGVDGVIGLDVPGDGGGDNGLSTILIKGLSGLLVLPGCGVGVGVLGISTTGLGVLCGTKSDCPLDRNIPFRTGHGALLDIFMMVFLQLIYFSCVLYSCTFVNCKYFNV